MDSETSNNETAVPPSAPADWNADCDPQPQDILALEADSDEDEMEAARPGRSPKITIATVAYNAGQFIGRTIRSVEEQTYPYVEHVIVDGNSQDDTLEHIHHYQERNSIAAIRHEIQCLSEPDHGLYDAMNKAIDLATGRYILFLNAGDRLHAPDTLQRIADAVMQQKERPAVVYGDTHIVDNEGNFLRKRRLAPPEHLTWRSFKNGMLVCHQAFFARIDLARKFHYNLSYRFSADYDWCIRIMREAARQHLLLVNSHTVVTDYLNDGLTTHNHHKSLRERLRIMMHHYGFMSAMGRHAWFVVRSITKK